MKHCVATMHGLGNGNMEVTWISVQLESQGTLSAEVGPNEVPG